jgi:hypothetical protein
MPTSAHLHELSQLCFFVAALAAACGAPILMIWLIEKHNQFKRDMEDFFNDEN